MMRSRIIPTVPFTWNDARRLGISRPRLTVMLRSGEVRRVLHNVYLHGDIPDTVGNRALAAALVMRAFDTLCDRTAAWLHGVDTFEFRELEILPPLETVALRSRGRTRKRGCAGGERDLAGRDVCVVGGVSVTTPLRTALDLACKLGRRDALAALDGFMRGCGITAAQLQSELVRYRGRRGVVQARELVPLADPRAESPGESWTRLTIWDAGLPMPTPQYWVEQAGVPTYRVDLAYPRSRVIVEYDGRDCHEGDEQEEHDRTRRAWLRRRGWTVIVVTKHDFKGPALDGWLDELTQALRIAA